MKAQFRILKMSWNGPRALALGLALSVGRRIGHGDLDGPTLSGFRFSLGLGFTGLEFICGLDYYRRLEPELKFLRLEKL